MPNRHVSIKISGTPVRKGGFIPIVNINDAFFDITDSYPSLLSRDGCVYSVSVLSDMTVYKLVFNRMRHSDGGAEARLVIGFSIPDGYALPDGTDAVSVLHTLLEAFVGSFAVALPDGCFEYRFGRFDTTSLEMICESITLVPSESRRVVMKEGASRGAIEVSGEKIAATLSDLDREEIAEISELIVAEHINTSLGGISVTLRADTPVPQTDIHHEAVAEDVSSDNIYTPEAVVDESIAVGYDRLPDYDIPLETEEKSTSGADNAYSHSVIQDEVNPDDGAPTHGRHQMWLPILCGVLAGGILVFLAYCLLNDGREANTVSDQDMIAITDSGAVATTIDTVAPAKVETVYVEKKVVVETVPASPRYNPSAGSQTQMSGTETTPSPDISDPAAVEDNNPAPVFKYDPEAERSL